ncbi:Zinc finger CCCH domain-containing protein 37 [Abeliophyllum distichum]|uniref:Zinc finger CCCH domain-containing protein 37 n=1 Tax=Abeliophyllum distichum TaxID=126358 RepID=A0ABD1QHY8_9LAMI
MPVYPLRPGEKDCAFYMQTRMCKYGESCKFDHPIWVPGGEIPDWKEGAPDNADASALPERPSELPCANEIAGDSKPVQPLYAPALLHNTKAINPLADAIAPVLASPPAHFSFGAVTPAASFFPTFDPRLTQTSLGLAPNIYLQRHPECDHQQKNLFSKMSSSLLQAYQRVRYLMEPFMGAMHCPYYMKTGTCKDGATCKFDHPPPGEVMAMATSQGASASAGEEVKENGEDAQAIELQQESFLNLPKIFSPGFLFPQDHFGCIPDNVFS